MLLRRFIRRELMPSLRRLLELRPEFIGHNPDHVRTRRDSHPVSRFASRFKRLSIDRSLMVLAQKGVKAIRMDPSFAMISRQLRNKSLLEGIDAALQQVPLHQLVN